MDKTSQSNCLFVPLLLKKDWLYFSETLLGPIRPFLNDHKHQNFFSWMPCSPALVGGGYFGANFAHFCLSVFYVFFYLLRIIQYFLTKFFTVVFGISLRITTLKNFFYIMSPLCWASFWDIFGPILTNCSWYLSSIFSWNFGQMLLMFFWGSLHYFSYLEEYFANTFELFNIFPWNFVHLFLV